MKSTALKSLAALLTCTLTAQAQPKNVLAEIMSQSETKPSIISLEVEKSLLGAKKSWETSKYFSADKQTSLQDLLKVTKEQIKNPRMQKMGGLDGGGGHAQICEEQNGITIQLLDLAEAAETDLQIDMGPGNHVQKLEYVFKRLAKIAPTYASYLASMANDLLTTDTQWPENSAMPTVEDSKVMALKRNCTIVQVAIQRPISQRNVPNAKTYVINKDIFTLLDENSKAALVLHEVLYRSARFSKQFDSVFSRNLTGLIASKQISKYTLKTFNRMLAKNSINCVEDERLPIMVDTSSNGSESCSYISYSTIKMDIKKTNYSWSQPEEHKPWQNLNLSSLNGKLELLGHYSDLSFYPNTEEIAEETESDPEMRSIKSFQPKDLMRALGSSGRISPTAFRITGELSFFPFTMNSPVKINNGFILNIPSDNPVAKNIFLAYGEVSFKTNRVIYKNKNYENKKFATMFHTSIGKDGTEWEIAPNPFGDTEAIAYQNSILQFKAHLPKVADIPKDANGWSNITMVKFGISSEIVSVRYIDSQGKDVIITDKNLLN